MIPAHFEPLGIAVLLGLLVGLQRQVAAAALAGLRTFPLVTLLGTVLALLDVQFAAHGWIVAAGFLGVVAVTALMSYHHLRQEPADFGLTTEMAMLFMYAVGAYLPAGDRVVAIALGGGVAVLLQFKPELHGIATRLGLDDVRAIMQFVLITCIVLPVLPNRTFGPWDVFNPHQTWLMVVLIVGISLAGYILYKFMPRGTGLLLGGLLGGAVSSTATTAAFAQRSRQSPESVPAAAVVIMLASSVLFVRVIGEVCVMAPNAWWDLAAPQAVLLSACGLTALLLWWWTRQHHDALPDLANPTELKSAIVFAFVYTLVQFALAAAQHYSLAGGTYAIAFISGLTDMDAITLSTARLVHAGPSAGGITAAEGWRLLVTAALANFGFKAGLVALFGDRRLFHSIVLLFLLPIAVGLGLLAWWQD